MSSRGAGSLAVCICAGLLAAGCGNSRTPVRGTNAGTAAGVRTLHYPSAGISLKAPASWSDTQGQGPLIATFTSGSSVVALWRFPRTAAVPRGRTGLRIARGKLIRKARGRDPGIDLIRANVTRVDGAPAIEMDAVEHINGRRRRVRSTHVFVARAEVVLDEYAPPQDFPAVDHTVFSPLKHSLLLSGASTA